MTTTTRNKAYKVTDTDSECYGLYGFVLEEDPTTLYVIEDGDELNFGHLKVDGKEYIPFCNPPHFDVLDITPPKPDFEVGDQVTCKDEDDTNIYTIKQLTLGSNVVNQWFVVLEGEPPFKHCADDFEKYVEPKPTDIGVGGLHMGDDMPVYRKSEVAYLKSNIHEAVEAIMTGDTEFTFVRVNKEGVMWNISKATMLGNLKDVEIMKKVSE